MYRLSLCSSLSNKLPSWQIPLTITNNLQFVFIKEKKTQRHFFYFLLVYFDDNLTSENLFGCTTTAVSGNIIHFLTKLMF